MRQQYLVLAVLWSIVLMRFSTCLIHRKSISPQFVAMIDCSRACHDETFKKTIDDSWQLRPALALILLIQNCYCLQAPWYNFADKSMVRSYGSSASFLDLVCQQHLDGYCFYAQLNRLKLRPVPGHGCFIFRVDTICRACICSMIKILFPVIYNRLLSLLHC